MALTPGMKRRKDGEGDNTVLLQSRVHPSTRVQMRSMAEACGVSMAKFMDEIAAHLAEDLDDTGRPTWFKTDIDHPELPLTG